MSAHLSDEQFTRYLSGEEDLRTHSHVEECEQCRAEAARLVGIVGASRAYAERSGDRHANFWTLQRNEVRYALAIRRPPRPTWAIASAMAALVFLSTFLFRTQEPRPQADQRQQTAASVISDDALLSAVNSTLDQDVPSALVPVQRLAYEREAAERNRSGQN
jgi:anti-sigma factor RsiW